MNPGNSKHIKFDNVQPDLLSVTGLLYPLGGSCSTDDAGLYKTVRDCQISHLSVQYDFIFKPLVLPSVGQC